MNKLLTTTGAMIFAAGLVAAPAQAAVITKDFNFTSHDFYSVYDTSTPPVDPMIGSVTITFDDAVNATNKTTGIVLNSLNIALDSPIGFTYFAGTQGMVIGGADATGVSVTSPGTNDFWIQIRYANTTPEFTVAAYSQAAFQNTAFLTPLSQTTVPSSAPEPQTWALLMLGFGAAGAMLRRRPKSAAAIA